MSIEKVTEFEKKLLDPEFRKNQSEVAKLLHADFTEFGTSGRVFNKKLILDLLKDEEPTPIVSFDFVAYEMSPEVIQIRFKTKRMKDDGTESVSLRSSIWKLVGNQWQMIFHQGTRSA